MSVSCLPQVALRLLADRSKQAVTHFMHHAIGTTGVILVFACTQVDLRPGRQSVGFVRDGGVMTTHVSCQEADSLQTVVVCRRNCVSEQVFHLIA